MNDRSSSSELSVVNVKDSDTYFYGRMHEYLEEPNPLISSRSLLLSEGPNLRKPVSSFTAHECAYVKPVRTAEQIANCRYAYARTHRHVPTPFAVKRLRERSIIFRRGYPLEYIASQTQL